MQELLQRRRRCESTCSLPSAKCGGVLTGYTKICAGTSNPKSDGLCKDAKGVKLWTGAPIQDEEIMDLATVMNYQNGAFDAKAAEECNADVPEKGHAVSGFAKSYNRDAFYTKAAACYIFKKLKGGLA